VQQAQQREQERLAQQQLAQQQAQQQAQAAERQRQQQAAAEQQRRQAQNNASSNALTRLILGGVAAAAGADANTVASTLNGTYSAPPPAPVPQPGYQQPAQQARSAPAVGGNVTACVYLASNGELHNTCDFQVEVLIAYDGCCTERARTLFYGHEDFPLSPDAAMQRMNLPIKTLPMNMNPRVLLACVAGNDSLKGTTGAEGDAGVIHAYCAG
jgi:hypothetical protein